MFPIPLFFVLFNTSISHLSEYTMYIHNLSVKKESTCEIQLQGDNEIQKLRDTVEDIKRTMVSVRQLIIM